MQLFADVEIASGGNGMRADNRKETVKQAQFLCLHTHTHQSVNIKITYHTDIAILQTAYSDFFTLMPRFYTWFIQIE